MIKKQLLRPMHYEPLARIGQWSDGGYVVPEDIAANAGYLLSLGICDDISFDMGFQQHNNKARCIGVDFTSTPEFLRQRYLKSLVKTAVYRFSNQRKYRSYKNLRESVQAFPSFFSNGNELLLKKVTAESGEGQVTISELVAMCSDSSACDIFLKMDIEGCEYEVMGDIVANQHRISCIAAEFHNLSSAAEVFNQAMESLMEHYYPVHIHGNNHGTYCSENDFPDVIEMTLVNKQLMPEPVVASSREYPVDGLDFPCHELRADFPLKFE